MAARPVQIERRIVVTGGGCKSTWPWVARNVELIDGTEYIQLEKKDSGFARFVSGAPDGARSMNFLDKLRAQRTTASIQLATPGEALFEAPPTKAARKAMKQSAAALRNKGALPPSVTLEMDGFTGVDGKEVPPTSFKVKSALDLKSPLYVELAPAALSYIREAMRLSDNPQGKQRAPSNTGVRWRPERRAWLAQRRHPETDKILTRSFQPAKPMEDENNKEDARQLALKWAAGEDDGAPSTEGGGDDKIADDGESGQEAGEGGLSADEDDVDRTDGSMDEGTPSAGAPGTSVGEVPSENAGRED